MKRYFRELSIAAALPLVLGALAVVAPAFFQPQPLLSLLTREAPTLIVACGMALVIIARQIDISVGSQFAVCSIVAGLLATKLPLVLVLPASVAIGAAMGAINGALVAGLVAVGALVHGSVMLVQETRMVVQVLQAGAAEVHQRAGDRPVR